MKNQPSPRLWLAKRPSPALPSPFVNDVPSRYALFRRVSGALHLNIFDQPLKIDFFNILPGACFAGRTGSDTMVLSRIYWKAGGRSRFEEAGENGFF
jgi:hypothetical protein